MIRIETSLQCKYFLNKFEESEFSGSELVFSGSEVCDFVTPPEDIHLFRNIPNERTLTYPHRCTENELTAIKIFIIFSVTYLALDFIGHLDISMWYLSL